MSPYHHDTDKRMMMVTVCITNFFDCLYAKELTFNIHNYIPNNMLYVYTVRSITKIYSFPISNSFFFKSGSRKEHFEEYCLVYDCTFLCYILTISTNYIAGLYPINF